MRHLTIRIAIRVELAAYIALSSPTMEVCNTKRKSPTPDDFESGSGGKKEEFPCCVAEQLSKFQLRAKKVGEEEREGGERKIGLKKRRE